MSEDILIEREEVLNSLLEEIGKQKDPRINRCKRFSLGEIFFLVLNAQICGYETFREYEAYGQLKLSFLKRFLPYKKGSPSRSTIARVLAFFDPKHLEKLFIEWMKKIVSLEATKTLENDQGVVAIDGKTHCGARGEEKLHLVSAFDTNSGLILGEEKVQDKSNEITAIPLLLDSLAVQGNLISIDAMGCQIAIAEKIISKGADYLLALKGNQGLLLEDVRDYFESKDCLKNCDVVTRVDKGHGRIEKRTCYTTNDINWIDKKSDWIGFKSIVMVIAERTINGKLTVEKRFYISSVKSDPVRLLLATRAHWGIENSLHWVLDVIFGEDNRIIWNQNIAQNESIIRRIALNLLKKYRLTMPTKSAKSEKIALKTLRKILSHDDEKMFKLLQAGF